MTLYFTYLLSNQPLELFLSVLLELGHLTLYFTYITYICTTHTSTNTITQIKHTYHYPYTFCSTTYAPNLNTRHKISTFITLHLYIYIGIQIHQIHLSRFFSTIEPQ